MKYHQWAHHFQAAFWFQALMWLLQDINCKFGLWVLPNMKMILCKLPNSFRVLPRIYSTSSIVVAHNLSCSMVYGNFLYQGSNLCLLQWQVDFFLPLSHLGSPARQILNPWTTREASFLSFLCQTLLNCTLLFLPTYFSSSHFLCNPLNMTPALQNTFLVQWGLTKQHIQVSISFISV